MRTIHASKQPSNPIRSSERPPLGWSEGHMRVLLAGLLLILVALALGGLS